MTTPASTSGSADGAQALPSPAPQSAAAPSPFPPIADYAFLSNCHTGALVGARRRDRLAVRAALRLAERVRHAAGPAGRQLPARAVRHQRAVDARVRAGHEHARHDVARRRVGWVVVRDALTLGPRRAEDTVTPHTRPPFDDDADHLLVRTVECIEGSVDLDLVCEPVFDYGRMPAEWTLVGDDRHTADASGAGPDDPAARRTWRSASRATACAPAGCSRRASAPTARCRGPRASPRPRTSTTPWSASRPRRASGGRGSRARGSPTTAGASRSSARRSPSRA